MAPSTDQGPTGRHPLAESSDGPLGLEESGAFDFPGLRPGLSSQAPWGPRSENLRRMATTLLRKSGGERRSSSRTPRAFAQLLAKVATRSLTTAATNLTSGAPGCSVAESTRARRCQQLPSGLDAPRPVMHGVPILPIPLLCWLFSRFRLSASFLWVENSRLGNAGCLRHQAWMADGDVNSHSPCRNKFRVCPVFNHPAGEGRDACRIAVFRQLCVRCLVADFPSGSVSGSRHATEFMERISCSVHDLDAQCLQVSLS